MSTLRTNKPVPLYQRVKDYISAQIDSGAWSEGHRVPSENELVRVLGASRMTVNRALRELTTAGRIRRIQGVGTFVAESKPQSEYLELTNIADEIRQRGHRYHNAVHCLREERADAALAAEMGLAAGDRVFHSILVHFENGTAVQLEDRFVNPGVAPDYLRVDFADTTPNEYLMRVAPLDQVEHVLEAVLPDPRTRELLRIGADTPCLLMRRRTWSMGMVASRARLVYPGPRYRLGARFTADAAAPARGPEFAERQEER